MSRALFQAALAALTFAVLTASAGTTASKAETHRTQWAAVNLSGQIDMVVPAHRRIVVKDSNGTTFDLVVTPHTRIVENGQRVKLADLASKTNDQVRVHFVPERKGDVASTIKLSQ